MDLCWPNCVWKVRQDGEGLQIMGSFQGYNRWRYSQQDLIESGLGGDKASGRKLRQRRRRRKQSQPNYLASLFFTSWPFFLLSFLGLSPACAARFVHFYAIRTVTEMTQGRMKTKGNSQLVLNTTTGLPLSSTFFIFLLSTSVYLPSYFPNAESQLLVKRHRCETLCLSPPTLFALPFLSFEFVCFDRRMNGG